MLKVTDSVPGYLSVVKAAKIKGVNPHHIVRLVRFDSFDAVKIQACVLVIDNKRFREWQPNRARQRGGLIYWNRKQRKGA